MMYDKSEIPPIFVGVEQACGLLAISRTHIHKLITEEKLRSVKLGRRTMFRYADLVAFADDAQPIGADDAA